MPLRSKLTHLIQHIIKNKHGPQFSSFEQEYQRAFHNEEFCSNWGTSKYFIDNHHDMYIGKGELQGRFYDIVGGKYAREVRTINLMEPIVAPVDSSYLFAEPDSIYTSEKDFLFAIHSLDRLDTSQVQNMQGMFKNDRYLQGLDLDTWDTSQVRDISFMFQHLSDLRNIRLADWDTRRVVNMRSAFNGTNQLTSLDLHHWETPHTDDMSWLFTNDTALKNLDLSNFDMSQAHDTSAMFLAMSDGTLIKMSPQMKKRRALKESKNNHHRIRIKGKEE